MDTPITRGEHEEFRNTIERHFDKVEAEEKRLNERIKIVEDTAKQIYGINLTLQKQSDNIAELSANISQMVKKQDDESARLKALENGDGEKWRKMWGYIIPPVITFLLGILGSALVTYFGG